MCTYILESYPWYHSVPKSFICCCSGRDSCMLTSRCMLPSLRSAPHAALCPCEPLRPVSDMQAVSYGARSRQYSPLLPASSSACLKNALGRFTPSALPHYKHRLPRLARSTLNELQQNEHEKASLVCVRVQSPSGLALVPCALSMVDLSGHLRC